MCALAVAPLEAPRNSAPARAGGPAPLYIVCSPSRRVGKTLVARFLTEYHLADGRPVVAYDLADETPQLADFCLSILLPPTSPTFAARWRCSTD